MEFQLLKFPIEYLFLILIFGNQTINTLRINEAFPIAFLLSNQDLFLVTQNGFRLYDPTLKTQKNVYNFQGDSRKIITADDAERVSIAQFSDGIIIALVQKYLYVLDINCNYKLEQNLNDILVNGYHYDLIAYKHELSFYYYIISYYDSTSSPGPFSIKYCRFSLDNTVTLINPWSQITYIPINSEGHECQIDTKGLSCVIMVNNEGIEVLACFYQLNFPFALGVTLFTINEISINVINIPKVFSPNAQSSIIKAVTSPDKKKSLICYMKYYDYAKCLHYDITSNQFSEETLFFNGVKGTYLGIQVYYIKEKNEYMLVTSNNQKGFQVATFDSNFQPTILSGATDGPMFNYGQNCYSVNTYNVIYLPLIDDYILINDCDVGGNVYDSMSINLEKLSDPNNNFPIDEDVDILYGKTIFTNKVEIQIPTHEEQKEDEPDTTYSIFSTRITLTNTPTAEKSNFEFKTEKIIENPTFLPTINFIIPIPSTQIFPTESIERIDRIDSTFIEKVKINKTNNTNVVFETSTQSKDEIINNLDDFINGKDPEVSYVINGDDYTVIIKPINEVVEESSVNIDFSECEKVLKEKYPTKEFRILQINMENKHENCLTDQVEYKIYDENGDEINLSLCDEVNIKIEYEIKNQSLLNLEQISNFKDQGVDVFNIKHDFFNDICYSYSDSGSNSDMILADRVADIYQNYSICGDGCEYESFNLDKVSANCNCKVKNEIGTESEVGKFETYMVGAFLDSNFGVAKCYNLVFSLKGKLKNAGFWIFGLMFIIHFPIYIFYIIKGTSPVINYINNEMNKKGYKANERSKRKKRSITPRLESRRKMVEKEETEQSLEKKRSKETFDSNPPKKQDSSFSSERSNNYNNNNNNKKHKIIKITELESKNKLQKNIEAFSDIVEEDKRKNILKNMSKRVTSPELIEIQEIKDILIGLTQNKKTEGKDEKKKIKFSEDNNNSNEKGKKHTKENIFRSIETHLNSPKKYIKKEKEKKIGLKKTLENKNNLEKESKVFTEKKKNHRNLYFKQNNNLVELDSGELLDSNKKLKMKKKSSRKSFFSKKNKSKNVKTTNDENEKEDKFIRRKIDKKMPTQFPLILINASNTKNHEAFKSNYVLDNYDFEEAIIKEQRTFCRIYFIFLISKENALNFIFYNPPLELKPIRLAIFIFSFACDFALNALFYLSDNISDKYHYNGAFRELYTLVNNIILSLLSAIVSFILLLFFRSLTQSNNKIEKLFREQENLLKADKEYKVNIATIKEIKNKIEKIIKCLNCKIIIFLILESIFMVFFFYYVTAFCQVYSNTQVSWLLDCLSSYIISLAIALAISFLFTVLYKISIKNQMKIFYKIIIFIYSV